jgi:tRNA(Ile)-lysidine synthase
VRSGESSPAGEASIVLDARLERGVAAPVAVAFSGGGDSLALLLFAKAWADGASRRLLALTVDHRIQAAGAEWAAWCADRAAALGVEHRVLTWRADKPIASLAVAARQARHRLIAEAARDAGAHIMLFGHTGDDVGEAHAMRLDGLSVPSPREFSPSPVWPEGRDLYILRPLLRVRRAEIRAALSEAGETWIEDPSNADPHQPRARMRALIAAASGSPRPEPPPEDLAGLFGASSFGPSGDVSIPAPALAEIPADQRRRFLAAAIACVSGGGPPARGPFFHRLAGLAVGEAAFSSTIGGALTLGDGENVRIVREIGDRRSRPAGDMALSAGESGVWDGRFEVIALEKRLTISPLAGKASRLAPAARKALAHLQPAVRRALPTIVDSVGEVACLGLADDPRVTARGLVRARLAGACGLIQTEAAAREGSFDGLVL